MLKMQDRHQQPICVSSVTILRFIASRINIVKKRRIEAVDYLRGVMALAIMLYHFTSWTSGVPDGNTILGRLGIYGVSIFYVLSGMSLYIAYRKTSWDKIEAVTFFKRRLLRIAPIYWVACFGVLILLKGYQTQTLKTIIGNLTLTFGFLDYTHYIPAGGWSIGNEICFYLIFPAIMISTKNTYIFSALCAALLMAYLHFAFTALSADMTLAKQWKTYIHPFNQAFLFAAGIIIAKISVHARHVRPSNLFCISLLTISLSALFLYSDTQDAIGLVTSTNRIAFTIFCLGACYACFNIDTAGKMRFEKILKHLGEISYSVYMLHGFLFLYLPKHLYKGFMKNLTPYEFAFYIVVPIVLIAATYSYRKIELPFIRLGKMNSGPFKDRLKAAFANQPARAD